MSRARNLAGFGSAVTSPENPVNIRVGYVTAIAYYGDGSELTGTPGGLGTALSDNLSDPLNKIYYTNANLSIASTITVDPPESASAAYTQYTDIVMQGDADLIVGDGDDFIPDILGIGTFVDMPGVLSGGSSKVRADNYTNKKGTGAAYVPYGLAVPVGAAVSIGNGTQGTPGLVGVDTTTGVFFPSAGEVAVTNNGSESIRVNTNGNVGIKSLSNWDTNTFTTALQVNNGVFFDYTGAQLDVGNNYYYDGSNYKFISDGYGSRITFQKSDGSIRFWTLGTGSAGDNATLSETLRITSGGQVQVSTGSTLQLGDNSITENTVYNYENIGGGTIRKYYVSDTLNSGQLTRFTFTGTDRTSAMITINATGSWTSSDTANNHVAAQFVSRVFTNSSGTSSDSSTITTPFAYTYSTSNYAFNNAGGNGYSIDITNPTGDSGVSFFYEVIIQNAVPSSQHVLTASSTA